MFFNMFIKNAANVDDPNVRLAYGKFTGIFGIVTNILLFITKVSLGLLTSSIAVIADAVNNLSDAGSSLITMLGFKIAGKPADEEHPFGHARMEYVSGLIVSCIISAIGIDLLISSVEKIFTPSETKYSVVGIIVLVATVVVKLLQGLVYRSAGKKINSQSLIASATDSINDVISTTVVIIGAIVGMLTSLSLDGYFGCAVAAFVIYSGIKLVIETTNPLLGEAPDEELILALNSKIMSYDGVLGIHDLMVHNYGFGKCFATAHAEVAADSDVVESHDLLDNIEYDVLREMNIHLVLHLDPVDNKTPEVLELKEYVKKKLLEMNSEVTLHDFRVVFGNTHTNVIFDVNLPFSYKVEDGEFTKQLTQKIRTNHPEVNTVITIDRVYMNSRQKN